jgi:dipeptidyl aminopeptidase/acylaminoacyl peptidase
VLSKLIEERFDNLNIIPSVKCPMLVIHGLKDDFIHCDHSKKLISEAKSKIK